MDKSKVLKTIGLAVLFVGLILMFSGCDMFGNDEDDTNATEESSDDTTYDAPEPIQIGATYVKSPYVGDMAVQSTPIDTTSTSKTLMFGNSEGTFTPASSSRAIFDGTSRSDSFSFNTRATENITFAASELLRRYTPEELSTSVSSYSFSSFKIVADIFLKSIDGHGATILYWGGGQNDLSNYVDLATGVLESSEDHNELQKRVYDTILLQINAPAETIAPDFAEDDSQYTEVDNYSWTDIKPFYSTSSSAQHVIISAFVDKPFAQWLGGDQSHLESDFPQLAEYGDLENWAFNGTIDQDFFDAVEQYNPQSDPYSGEAWVFLPMYERIDLRDMDSVTISLEMFMKGLLEVYEYDETIAQYEGATPYRDGSERIHVLSSGKNYTDEEGNVYYAPLPIKVSYAENPNGMNVNPKSE